MKKKIIALCSMVVFVLAFGMVAHAQGAKVAGTKGQTPNPDASNVIAS